MKVCKEIRDKIISDNEFSLKIALALKKSQQSIRLRAERNSEALGHEKAVEIYREFGFIKIFEDED